MDDENECIIITLRSPCVAINRALEGVEVGKEGECGRKGRRRRRRCVLDHHRSLINPGERTERYPALSFGYGRASQGAPASLALPILSVANHPFLPVFSPSEKGGGVNFCMRASELP